MALHAKNLSRPTSRKIIKDDEFTHSNEYGTSVVFVVVYGVVGGGGGVVVVLTLTHRYNAVRRHRTGSSNAGAEIYLRRTTGQNRR